jgi:hypothetical protein
MSPHDPALSFSLAVPSEYGSREGGVSVSPYIKAGSLPTLNFQVFIELIRKK